MESFLEEIQFDAWNLEQDRGRPYQEGIALLCRQFPAYRSLIEAYHHRWEESIAGPIQPTVDIVFELHEAGYRLFGLSNWSAETFGFVRNRYEVFDLFELIVLSGAIKMAKPDPEIFRYLLEQGKVRAEECLFIDDAVANITAARALGFETIRYESPQQLRMELESRRLLGVAPAARKRVVG
jgi:2-haloacid dehalogenase